jgi:hypothetical protein
MIFSIITTIAAETSTIAVNHPQTIDFSVLDTIVGAVIAIAAMIVVGLVLFKYGVVRIGGDIITDTRKTEDGREVLADRELRRADRNEIRIEITNALEGMKELICDLRDDMREYLKSQQECQRMLPEKYVQWEAINRILTELKEDRMRRWDKFDVHTHDDHSGVVVLRKTA